jgi:hypothetical protein
MLADMMAELLFALKESCWVALLAFGWVAK